jgi:hypothetical protein
MKGLGYLLSRETTEGMRTGGELSLPSSYYLDESDPDILLLRRQDGAIVAAFSAWGATKEGIVKTAEEDRRGLAENSTLT